MVTAWAPSRKLLLAPLFGFDSDELHIPLSDDLFIRLMTDEEVNLIRRYEGLYHALEPSVAQKLRLAIACKTEMPKSIFDNVIQRALDRINLVVAAIRIWAGVIAPWFLRIEVSNVLYAVPADKQLERSEFVFEPLQVIKLRSTPPPIAGSEIRHLSKADTETLSGLVKNMEKLNNGRMKVAFQRLRMFCDEAWPEKMIDAMIGFEALYCNPDNRRKGEVIAAEAAKLIGKDFDERVFIDKFLIEAYRLRNAIVHGDDVNPNYWADLTKMVFENELNLKPALSEPQPLPPAIAIETLGAMLCRSIQVKLSQI